MTFPFSRNVELLNSLWDRHLHWRLNALYELVRVTCQSVQQSINLWPKWRRDKRYLPLTPEHYPLYKTIHYSYKSRLGRWPELVNCLDFNDRIQWLKLFDQSVDQVRCSDKVRVRDYIADRVGNKYLPKLFQVCNQFEEIQFESLPDSFVIKTNHDSGTVFPVRDKNQIDLDHIRLTIESAIKDRHGVEKGEWPYSFVIPRILIEEYICVEGDLSPPDYKFYVVEGRVAFLHFITDRFSDPKEQIIDPAGFDLNVFLYNKFKYIQRFSKPSCWDTMKRIAVEVGKRFKFVRVDMYECKGNIYVGEMTFFPMGGCYEGEGQKKLGALLDFDRSTFKAPVYQKLTRN